MQRVDLIWCGVFYCALCSLLAMAFLGGVAYCHAHPECKPATEVKR
jgi:hypothetical protein